MHRKESIIEQSYSKSQPGSNVFREEIYDTKDIKVQKVFMAQHKKEKTNKQTILFLLEMEFFFRWNSPIIV